MRIRDVVLQDRLAQLVDARTWTFNINLVDPVTEFKVWFYAKTHATGPNEAGCIPYLIKEVAIIDGSEVIASMNGAQCFSLYCFDHGKEPFVWHQEQGGMSNYWCLPITFGRHLWDPNWIFDPTRFRNPQIRITFDLANVAAVGANAWATGTAQISVWAKIMEEGADPVGYFMSKELKEFASLASGQEITYLPTDFPIRKLMVRAYKKAGDMTDAITRLKLSQDEDKWIPWDLNSADFIFLMRDWFPEIYLHLKNQADNNEQREHYGGQYAHGMICGGEDIHITNVSGFANNIYTLEAETDAGAGATDVIHWIETTTRTPFDHYCYPFGDQQKPETWLDVGRMGNLRLILTQGSTGYTEEIVVQQAHPY